MPPLSASARARLPDSAFASAIRGVLEHANAAQAEAFAARTPLAIPSTLDATGEGFEVQRTSAAGTTSGGSGRRRR